MIKKTSFIAALFLSVSAFSQHVKISEINISSGSGNAGKFDGTLDNFKILAPNSSILTKDFSQFHPEGFPMFMPRGMNQSSYYSLQLGLQCEKMPRATFRVGITHVSNWGALSTSGFYSESGHYDTLVSTQTGSLTIIDTTRSKSYNMNYYNQQIRLDGAMIFRMFGEKRWSLQAGLGASIGMSYMARTELHYSEYTSGNYNYSSNTIPQTNNVEINESFKNKNALGASLYIPLGFDFGLGKKRDFWMPFHLYAEMRPSLNIQSISGIGTSFSPGMNSAVGLRVKI